MRKKRLLSALMVLAMSISLVPVQVLAAFDDGSWVTIFTIPPMGVFPRRYKFTIAQTGKH